MVSTTDEPVVTETAPTIIPKEIDMNNITEQDVERAQKMFQLGKKNLFLNKFDEAANNIGEACDVFSAKYGEMDPRCAELYFYYGRVLLELARVENTVLGNALNGVPEENGSDDKTATPAANINDSRYGNPDDVAEEEKQEISEKVIDAMCEKEDVPKQQDETATTTATSTDEPMKTDETVATKPAETDKPENSEKPTTSNGETAKEEEEEDDDEDEEDEEDEDEAIDSDDKANNKETGAAATEDEEDVSNLQRAWEMFELAKVIYTKHFNDDPVTKNKRIAECLLKLGEIGCEQEFYEQACGDIAESIRLQEAVEDKESRDERMLAESYYQLGLAQQFANKLVDAREAFQRAINILQLRIEKLKGKMANAAAEVATEAEINTWRDEITEIESLVPDVTAKLEECADQPAQVQELMKEAITTPTTITTTETPVNGTSEVKDITQMVKSKRKMGAEPESTSKKTRLSGDMDDEPPQVQTEPVPQKEETTIVETIEVTTTTTTTVVEVKEQA